MNAREEILAKIRGALGVTATDPAASYARVSRSYQRVGKLDATACLNLLVDRLLDYDCEVLQVNDEADLPGAIAAALLGGAADRALVAPSFPKSWLPADFHFTEDRHLITANIEGAPAVVTTCEAAVAATGTIFLVHGRQQARRVLTLLPNHHICLIRRDQVYELLPEAIAAIKLDAAKPITTISGPSATSDIEMTRIRGVHGPRQLTAILYS
jgi:L-lactate dehydrogenase complex protein LldG